MTDAGEIEEKTQYEHRRHDNKRRNRNPIPMSSLALIAIMLAAWFLLGTPIALLVGKMIKEGNGPHDHDN